MRALRQGKLAPAVKISSAKEGLAKRRELWLISSMSSKEALIDLLRRRESIIADHAWRDRDSASHLEALKEVSIAISQWPAGHDGPIDPKLAHYLANASYAKALSHLEAICEAG